jgi:hypothetical protein
MGLIVHDNIEIPNFPLSVSRANCHLTIRGSYNIRKDNQYNNTLVYTITASIYWYENVSSTKIITAEPYTKQIQVLPDNIFTYIYDDIASRYTSTEVYQPISQV